MYSQEIPHAFSLDNSPPTHDIPDIYSSNGENTTLEDIISNNQSTIDPEGDYVTNIYNWFLNGESFVNLNMPFDTNDSLKSRDYSPYENNGTLYGGLAWSSEGVVGGAYDFDGVDDYIEVPDSDSLDGGGTWREISIEFWLKPQALQRGAYIVAKDGSYRIGFKPSLSSQENILYWKVLTSNDYNYEVEYSTPLETDVWHHVVVTYKWDSVSMIYIDGSAILLKVNSGRPRGYINDTLTAVDIGSLYGEASTYFDGVIDGLRIYPERLNAMQIQQLYMESKDGLSNSSAIVSQQTEGGEIWSCEVTPTDGKEDGVTRESNSLTVLQGPDVMGLEWMIWTKSTGRGVLISDVVGDEREEIIHSGADGGWVTLYNSTTGGVIWQVEVPGANWYAQMQMADLNLDGILEIVIPVGDPYNNVGLHVLHANNGSTFWRTTGPWGQFTAAPVIGDIDGDGYPSIFGGTTDIYHTPRSGYQSRVMAFNPLTGEVMYWTRVWRLCAGGLSLADTDSDGVFELYGGDRSMYAGDGGFGRGLVSWWADNLTLRWFEPEIMMSSNIPVLADVDKDGILDVIGVHLDGGIEVLNSKNGKPIRKNLGLPQLGGHYQYSVHDIDLDGNLEILLADGDHSSTPDDVTVWDLYEWREDFRFWAGESFYGPMLADVNGDGHQDMIVSSEEGVFVFDHEFNLIGEYEGTSGVLNYPMVQDVDKDGKNDIFLTAGGKLYKFWTNGTAPNPRARTEVQLYSEQRLGASEYVPFTYVNAPQILNALPRNATKDVPISVTNLSFDLLDFQVDSMDYYVNSIPDIGSGEGHGVTKGTYNVAVSGLDFLTTYVWHVNVTDGNGNWTNNTYTFTTAEEGWFGVDWPYRKGLSVDHTLVSEDFLDFPLLIEIDDADLAEKAQADGGDIVFADEDGVKLSHEIESYEDGHLWAWVKIPFLNSSGDTIIYVYYGNIAALNQENPEAVWTNGYSMVHHMEETSGEVFDSTENDNDGVRNNPVTTTPGVIDGALEFDGSTGYIEIPSDPSISGFTDALTVSTWMRLNYRSTRQSLLHKWDVGAQKGWFFEYRNWQDATAFFAYNGTDYLWWYSDSAHSADTWYHVAVVWESGVIPSFYVDGALVSTFQLEPGVITEIFDNSDASLAMGRSTHVNDYYLNGTLDEARVSDVARSSAWINMEYLNQLNPATYVSIGSEEYRTDAPDIINPEPVDNEDDLPVSISWLNFTLTDPNGDLMEYEVVTNPDIGSQAGVGVSDGTYSMSVAGLIFDTTYSWWVNVSDGTDWTMKTFSFTTKVSLNEPPSQDTPVLQSSLGQNTTSEDLNAFNMTSVDPDGDNITNVYNWFKNGESLTRLNLPFDVNRSTQRDFSSYDNDATVIGATWTDEGVVGGAYSFDGVDDYILVHDSDTLDGGGSWDQMMIEFWAKPTALKREPYLIAKSSSYRIGFQSSGSKPANTLYARFYNYTRYYHEVEYQTPLEVDMWYHIVVMFESGANAAIYINGTAVPITVIRAANPGYLFDSGENIDIGRKFGGWEDTSGNYQGLIDGIRIYPSKLSDEQIMQLYLDSKDGDSSSSTIVAEETEVGDVWSAQVTPSDGQIEGAVQTTNLLTVLEGSPERLYSVVRTLSDGISYNSWTSEGSWKGWISLPGSTIERPAAALLDNNLHLVVRGTTGGIYHGWVNLLTDVFSGWTKISGDTPSPPVLTTSTDTLYLAVRGTNNGIYYRAWDGSWGSWNSVPGSTVDAPGITVLDENMHIVLLGTNGVMYHGYENVGTSIFSGWTSLSGVTPSSPVLTSDTTSVYLVVRGSNNRIYYREWDGTWSGWSAPLPGTTPDSPGASIVGTDMHIVVRGSTGGIYHGWIDLLSSTFSGWTMMTGDTPSPPTLAGD